jgi:hypothetical protein
MTELAAAPGTTVQLIRRVSSGAEAGVSPTVLLERVCEAVVDALAFVYEPAMPHGARFEVVLPVRL